MYIKIILSVFIYSFLTSCSDIKNVDSDGSKISEVLFFKGPAPIKGVVYAYPQALFEGYLVKKGKCLYLSPKQNPDTDLYGIIWPWDYSLSTIGNKLVVRNGSHIKIAVVGAFVKLGGGYYATGEINNYYSQCNGIKVKETFSGYSLRDFK